MARYWSKLERLLGFHLQGARFLTCGKRASKVVVYGFDVNEVLEASMDARKMTKMAGFRLMLPELGLVWFRR